MKKLNYSFQPQGTDESYNVEKNRQLQKNTYCVMTFYELEAKLIIYYLRAYPYIKRRVAGTRKKEIGDPGFSEGQDIMKVLEINLFMLYFLSWV